MGGTIRRPHGNFGGIDTDAVSAGLDRVQMKEYILDVIRQCEGHGGFAFGSGNRFQLMSRPKIVSIWWKIVHANTAANSVKFFISCKMQRFLDGRRNRRKRIA